MEYIYICIYTYIYKYINICSYINPFKGHLVLRERSRLQHLHGSPGAVAEQPKEKRELEEAGHHGSSTEGFR